MRGGRVEAAKDGGLLTLPPKLEAVAVSERVRTNQPFDVDLIWTRSADIPVT